MLKRRELRKPWTDALPEANNWERCRDTLRDLIVKLRKRLLLSIFLEEGLESLQDRDQLVRAFHHLPRTHTSSPSQEKLDILVPRLMRSSCSQAGALELDA